MLRPPTAMVFSHLTLMGGGILTSRSPSLSQMLRPVPACILITFLTITSVPPIRQITQMLRILGVGSTPFPDTTVPAHAIPADPAHATAPIAFRMTFSYQAGQFAAVPAIVDELLIGHVIDVHSHTSPLVNLRKQHRVELVQRPPKLRVTAEQDEQQAYCFGGSHRVQPPLSSRSTQPCWAVRIGTSSG